MDAEGAPAPDARVGIIVNPRSHGHARHAAQIAAARLRHPAILQAAPESRPALGEALARFHHDGVTVIVVNGGDGTLRDVLTALPAAYPAAPPAIALLPGGNTNLAAQAIGAITGGGASLSRLIAAIQAGNVRRRPCPVLEVRWIGQPERPALRGLFFGAGAYPEAKRVADAEIHRRGLHSRLAVGLTLVLTLVRAMAGGSRLRDGIRLFLEIDGRHQRVGDRFLVLATTLDRLTLGLWPFWGDGSGAIRWLDIDAPPTRLGAAILAVLRGRPRPWMAAAGYRSGCAGRIGLPAPLGFVMDGEFFDAGPMGIELSAAAAVTFVWP